MRKKIFQSAYISRFGSWNKLYIKTKQETRLLFLLLIPHSICSNLFAEIFPPKSIMHFFLLQSLFPFLLIASFLSINFELSLCQNDQQITICSSDINCGGVRGISYPFWGINRASYCGKPGFEVQCLDNVPVFNMTGANYRILQMNTTTNSRTVKVARHDYWGTICSQTFVNTTLNFSLFDYVSGYTNMTFYYQCSNNTIGLPSPGSCPIGINKDDKVQYGDQYGVQSPVFYSTRSTVGQPSSGNCTHEVIVPVYTEAALAIDSATEPNQTIVTDALDGGFSLQLEIDNDQCDICLESGGQCGLNPSTNSGFRCFCADQDYASICNSSQTGGKGKPIKLIVSLTVVCFIGVLGAVVFGFCRMRAKQKGEIKLTRDTLQEYIRGKNDELLVYDFETILVATDNFSTENKLGQGGFGPVYKVITIIIIFRINYIVLPQF
ncbi:hypothetical protein C1H46_018323 [Malus baccata]|uniref:non-specific serine/threonine protein kinase n=1 Tax=Malus baccata TaxID=106549 RepID=A0A540MBG2_MALBA|nr:hypothetical protein C1H46_018323 [Malus baccata]